MNKLSIENDFVHPPVIFIQTSVLTRAIKCESPRRVKFLLSRGCDPNSPTSSKEFRPLMVACYVQNPKHRIPIFETLLEYGAEPRLTDVHGRNSVMYACALSLLREVSMMIEDCEYDLNVTDDHGDTLLHICAKAGNVDVLKRVMKEMYRYRLDINIQNNDSLTPLSLAILNGHLECAKILYEAGGSPRFPDFQIDNTLSCLCECSRKRQSSMHVHMMKTLFDPTKVKLAFDGKDTGASAKHQEVVKSYDAPHSTSDWLPHINEKSITPRLIPDTKLLLSDSYSPTKEHLIPLSSKISVPKGPSSLDYINALLSSQTYITRHTLSYSSPPKNVAQIDSNWLATIKKYKELEGMKKYETVQPHQKVLVHMTSSFPLNTSVSAQQRCKSELSSSSTGSSRGSNSVSKVLLRSQTSPEFANSVIEK